MNSLTVTVSADKKRKVRRSKTAHTQALKRIKIPKKKSKDQAEIYSALAVTPLQEPEKRAQSEDGKTTTATVVQNKPTAAQEAAEKRKQLQQEAKQRAAVVHKLLQEKEKQRVADRQHQAKVRKEDKKKEAKEKEAKQPHHEEQQHRAVLTAEREAERDRQARLRREQVPVHQSPEMEMDIFESDFGLQEVLGTIPPPPGITRTDNAVNEIDQYLQELVAKGPDPVDEPSPSIPVVNPAKTKTVKRIRCRRCHGRGHHHSECTAISARQLRRLATATGVSLFTKTPKKIRTAHFDLIPKPPSFLH